MTLSKKKLALIVFLAWGLGVGMNGVETEPKPVQPKTVTKVEYVQKDLATWKELKTLDDEIMVTAGEGLQTCAKGITAAINSDVEGLNVAGQEAELMADTITDKGVERARLLKKLGY